MIILYHVLAVTIREEHLFQLVPNHGFHCEKENLD